MLRSAAALILWLAALSLNAPAQASERLHWTFDSHGTAAFFLQGELQDPYPQGMVGPDPGPGGLGAVLSYFIANASDPALMVAGDVQLCLSLALCDVSSTDILRFNSAPGAQGVFVYSSPFFPRIGEPGSLADTPSSPLDFYANRLFFEITADDTTFFYKPEPGQPGYINAFDGRAFEASYTYVTRIPEPGTALLVASALAMLGLAGARGARRPRARAG
ncbi:hypothetical protein [Elioraea sp.]|uniref:hypothetical protein n=1 Tax=Elioraea sp. TaxID=2185103 RepID=UPI0025C3CA33|nr:hypothetical protein [Elioraea sp.]